MRAREGQARAMTLPVDQNQASKDPRGKWSHNPLIVAVIPALIIAIGGYLAGARTGHVLGIAVAPTVTETVTQAPASGNGGGGPTSRGQVMVSKTGLQLTD